MSHYPHHTTYYIHSLVETLMMMMMMAAKTLIFSLILIWCSATECGHKDEDIIHVISIFPLMTVYESFFVDVLSFLSFSYSILNPELMLHALNIGFTDIMPTTNLMFHNILSMFQSIK